MHLKYFLNKRKQAQLPIFPRVAETQLIVYAILVHLVCLIVLKLISVLAIEHAELRAKLNKGVKA